MKNQFHYNSLRFFYVTIGPSLPDFRFTTEVYFHSVISKCMMVETLDGRIELHIIMSILFASTDIISLFKDAL